MLSPHYLDLRPFNGASYGCVVQHYCQVWRRCDDLETFISHNALSLRAGVSGFVALNFDLWP